MNTPNQPTTEAPQVDPDTLRQIDERLAWTPADRLGYLEDMIDFEQRARGARRLS